jgi:hypothetical protein
MSIADDLLKLQGLRESGAISDEEFEVAKSRLLTGTETTISPRPDVIEQQLKEISRQNDLASIDREWELSRENYMVRGEHGHRYIPSRGMSVLSGVIVVGFGIVWLTVVASMGGPGGLGFGFFGLLFILAGIGISIHSFGKADAYEAAQREYHARRKQLMDDRLSD